MIEVQRDRLRTLVLPDRGAMGAAAAAHAAERLRGVLAAKPRARVIFAAAASQMDMLEALAGERDIDWSCVDAFHLDEYVGLVKGDPRSFGRWLEDHVWARVRPGRVELIDGGNPDPASESDRYGRLLDDGGIDLGLIGIGENGHLAFNDPHVADFEDPLTVKPVEIDETSRHQQVRDGAFAAFDDVPRLALTVTMSAILRARSLSVVVPGPQKAAAVQRTLDGPVDTACPASALRRHPDAVLFVDQPAFSLAAPTFEPSSPERAGAVR
ncbi:MAG TPA: 6-phosphogluconolactonase [Candidatus Limnocylindria bacterium]|nr:6-phosphogluconolactonase [Candidatus Limnocylindria bacterium]